jgi:hypothetical protein
MSSPKATTSRPSNIVDEFDITKNDGNSLKIDKSTLCVVL